MYVMMCNNKYKKRFRTADDELLSYAVKSIVTSDMKPFRFNSTSQVRSKKAQKSIKLLNPM